MQQYYPTLHAIWPSFRIISSLMRSTLSVFLRTVARIRASWPTSTPKATMTRRIASLTWVAVLLQVQDWPWVGIKNRTRSITVMAYLGIWQDINLRNNWTDAGTKVNFSENKLATFLQEVSDEPGCSEYVAAPSNSLLGQALTSRAWPQTSLAEQNYRNALHVWSRYAFRLQFCKKKKSDYSFVQKILYNTIAVI